MLGINSFFGKTIDSTAAMQRTEERVLYMRCRSGPVLRRLRNQSVMQGRSSDSFRFRRLPGYPPVAEIVDSSCARFRTGTYSSGNCCRLSRHSLLIDQRLKTSFFEPLLGKDIKLDSNKKIFFISGCRFALGTLFIPLSASFFRSYHLCLRSTECLAVWGRAVLSLTTRRKGSRHRGDSGKDRPGLKAPSARRPGAEILIRALRPPAEPSVNISLRVLAFGQSP